MKPLQNWCSVGSSLAAGGGLRRWPSEFPSTNTSVMLWAKNAWNSGKLDVLLIAACVGRGAEGKVSDGTREGKELQGGGFPGGAGDSVLGWVVFEWQIHHKTGGFLESMGRKEITREFELNLGNRFCWGQGRNKRSRMNVKTCYLLSILKKLHSRVAQIFNFHIAVIFSKSNFDFSY